MMISADSIRAYLEDATQRVALSNIADKRRTHDETVFDRGRYQAYKEILSHINTHYSEE